MHGAMTLYFRPRRCLFSCSREEEKRRRTAFSPPGGKKEREGERNHVFQSIPRGFLFFCFFCKASSTCRNVDDLARDAVQRVSSLRRLRSFQVFRRRKATAALTRRRRRLCKTEHWGSETNVISRSCALRSKLCARKKQRHFSIF